MSNNIKLSFRIAVSLICFAVVLYIIDFDSVIRVIGNIRLEIILLSLLVMLIGHIGSGLRFHFIVNRLNRRLGMKDAIKISFVALWFNQLLPTGMGGDVVRVIMLANIYGRVRIVLAALLDRVFGLLWMVLMLLCFLPIVLYEQLGFRTSIVILMFCISILLIGVVPMWLGKIGCIKFKKIKLLGVCRFIKLFGQAQKNILKPLKLHVLILSLALSFFPYVIYVALIGESFSLALTVWQYLAVVPIIFIAMQFPISVGGWGVRELASLYVFSIFGITEEAAVVISMLYGIGLLITSIPGNFFWVHRNAGIVADRPAV